MSEVVLPALGESVTEGTITRWLKKVGDTVAVDEALVEVSTDKVDTEIPSPVAGVIQQIMVQEDETVAVGAVLVIIGDSAAAPAEAPAAPAPVAAPVVETPAPVAAAPVAPAPVVAPPVAPAPVVSTPPQVPPIAAPVAAPVAQAAVSESDPNYITPIVRKLANDMGVNLANVQGTGVGGRIRKEDVLAAGSGTHATTSAPAAPVQTAASPLRGTTESMSRLRKVLAERAVASMQSTAQLTTVVEVDVTRIANLRKSVQAAFTAKTGVKLNFMPFFTLAAAEALQAHPKINSSVEGETIVYHPSENISFAVDTEKGLLTPVIRDAASLNIAQIAQQISDLAARTRASQLKPDELAGGTFTLTNTGSRGALFDTPVVFLPQSAILGTGIVTKRPAVVTDADGNEAIAIRSLVYLALSYDHRTIDGADASRFLTDLKKRLEDANFEANLGI
ncbi:MAG: 2-oxoglutarate dehydrogenase, E2 component, dihydrolipoamide succinyltransferase [Aquiluna sp.]|nr:2-oxoglutarate dehydrogenase, E2 component, dihydrolipoamide succinyltransferase [Aquiluna sp.]MCF8545140.1 2-oxoglutarate dehydrogenase, E2 component, dihydrolipoamide succinyltransferase [Aquiluna sp.]